MGPLGGRRRPEHERCPRCWLQRGWCICERVPRLDTGLRFVVVRHWKEAARASNSARLASLALRRCEVLDYGARGATFDPSPLQGPDTWLLFPPEPPSGVPPGTLGEPAPPPVQPPATVVLVDGSWPQARRLSHRVPVVKDLPRFVLLEVEQRERLRAPPAPWAMATIEAIARALDHYGEAAAARALDALFAEFVRRSLAQKGMKPTA